MTEAPPGPSGQRSPDALRTIAALEAVRAQLLRTQHALDAHIDRLRADQGLGAEGARPPAPDAGHMP